MTDFVDPDLIGGFAFCLFGYSLLFRSISQVSIQFAVLFFCSPYQSNKG